MSEYTANAGQTYFPIQENIHVDFMPFQHPAKPEPLLKPLELSKSYQENGFVLSSQKQHFLPGERPKCWTGFGQTWKKAITCGHQVHINVSAG